MHRQVRGITLVVRGSTSTAGFCLLPSRMLRCDSWVRRLGAFVAESVRRGSSVGAGALVRRVGHSPSPGPLKAVQHMSRATPQTSSTAFEPVSYPLGSRPAYMQVYVPGSMGMTAMAAVVISMGMVSFSNEKPARCSSALTVPDRPAILEDLDDMANKYLDEMEQQKEDSCDDSSSSESRAQASKPKKGKSGKSAPAASKGSGSSTPPSLPPSEGEKAGQGQLDSRGQQGMEPETAKDAAKAHANVVSIPPPQQGQQEASENQLASPQAPSKESADKSAAVAGSAAASSFEEELKEDVLAALKLLVAFQGIGCGPLLSAAEGGESTDRCLGLLATLEHMRKSFDEKFATPLEAFNLIGPVTTYRSSTTGKLQAFVTEDGSVYVVEGSGGLKPTSMKGRAVRRLEAGVKWGQLVKEEGVGFLAMAGKPMPEHEL